MWFWNVTEIFLIISFGVEVVEVIKFDFSPNIYQDVLVVFTLIIQNISVWQYLKRRHQHATWVIAHRVRLGLMPELGAVRS